MPACCATLVYEVLDKPELIGLLHQRDRQLADALSEKDAYKSAFQDSQSNLIAITGKASELQRILNMRNKQIFGSSSEQGSKLWLDKGKIEERVPLEEPEKTEDIEYEEVKAGEKVCSARPSDNKQQQAPNDGKRYGHSHPGRNGIPPGLRREEQHLYPAGYDSSSSRQMPPVITERIVCRVDIFVEALYRHKFAASDDKFVIAPYPGNDPFFRHRFTTETVATIIAMRFAMHVPFYRFHQQWLKPLGVSYGSMFDNAKSCYELLAPLETPLHTETLACTTNLGIDETVFGLLDTPQNINAKRAELQQQAKRAGLPTIAINKKQSKANKYAALAGEEEQPEEIAMEGGKKKIYVKGYMWTLCNEQKGLVYFAFSPSRATINALHLLADFKGRLMADGYSVYKRIAERMGVDLILLCCWVHARRYFLQAADPKHPDPVVKEVIAIIASLYKIEKEIKNCTAQDKEAARKQSILILQSLKAYLEEQQHRYTPKEAVSQAIQYCLNRWEALSAYARYGATSMDNNRTERAIRPLTLGRKNILFLGSLAQAKGAALLYSLMECCRLHQVDPFIYLTDVMGKISSWPRERMDELLPHKWKVTIRDSKPPS
jgi:hypothetical protein